MAEQVFEFTREWLGGEWNAPQNTARGQSLAAEIEAALPGMPFCIRCDGEAMVVTCMQGLSDQQRADLDGAVVAHKLNVTLTAE